MDKPQELKEIVEKGILSDVFRAERAHSVLKEIGMNASLINADLSMSELFAAISTALQTETLLSVSRLFDTVSNRYPTKSIKQTLKFLNDNKAVMPFPKQVNILRKQMENLGFSDASISKAFVSSDQFIEEVCYFFIKRLDSINVQEDIVKLKQLRDKSLAHNEISNVSGPTWKVIMELVAIAKELIGILGWAYLDTAYIHEDDFFLTRDAIRPSFSVSSLINAAIRSND